MYAGINADLDGGLLAVSNGTGTRGASVLKDHLPVLVCLPRKDPLRRDQLGAPWLGPLLESRHIAQASKFLPNSLVPDVSVL